MDKVPMTVHGAEMLREELEQLKTVERPKVVQDIAEAREHGDLKENSEYLIDVTKLKNEGKVVFGATVTVYRPDEDKEIVYKIVGEDEADLSKNLISVYTPIAKGLIGKEIDDTVSIKVPAGLIKMEIVDVQYI